MLHEGLNPWIGLIALSATVASFAQVLLKKSAAKKHDSVIKEYLNPYVIFGYGLMFVGMFLTIIAYGRGVNYKEGPIMESIANIWIVILSYLFFREPITKRKVLGNLIILIGIVVFYFDWSAVSETLAFMNADLFSLFG